MSDHGPGPGDKSDELYDSGTGPLGPDGITGGSVQFDQTDQKGRSSDHHNIHGTDRHFSWDTDQGGYVSGMHGEEHYGGNRSPW